MAQNVRGHSYIKKNKTKTKPTKNQQNQTKPKPTTTSKNTQEKPPWLKYIHYVDSKYM